MVNNTKVLDKESDYYYYCYCYNDCTRVRGTSKKIRSKGKRRNKTNTKYHRCTQQLEKNTKKKSSFVGVTLAAYTHHSAVPLCADSEMDQKKRGKSRLSTTEMTRGRRSMHQKAHRITGSSTCACSLYTRKANLLGELRCV